MSLWWLVAQSLYTRACWKKKQSASHSAGIYSCVEQQTRGAGTRVSPTANPHAARLHTWFCGTTDKRRRGAGCLTTSLGATLLCGEDEGLDKVVAAVLGRDVQAAELDATPAQLDEWVGARVEQRRGRGHLRR